MTRELSTAMSTFTCKRLAALCIKYSVLGAELPYVTKASVRRRRNFLRNSAFQSDGSSPCRRATTGKSIKKKKTQPYEQVSLIAERIEESNITSSETC